MKRIIGIANEKNENGRLIAINRQQSNKRYIREQTTQFRNLD